MADLAKTSSQWKDDFFRRFLAFLQVARVVYEQQKRFTREREQVLNLLDANENFDAVTLSGLKHGVNTDDRGRVFVRVTGASNPYTVTLYKATGGDSGDAVAAGSANAGADVTLTASNNSVLTGTITLASSVTAETDDAHYLSTYLDWRKHALNVFASDGTTDKDTQSRNEFEDMLVALAGDCDTMLARIVASLTRFAIRFANGDQGYAREFLSSGATSLISSTSRQGGSGEVTRTVQGLLVDLRLAMEDDSNGEQDVARIVVAGAAGVFASNNTGAGAVASHTPKEHCPAGRHRFVCVDSTVGRERFRHEFTPDDGGPGFVNEPGPTVGQSYTGPQGFGPITITRTLAKTGDGSNLNLAAVSGFSISGESPTNTNSGVLYWRIVANSSNWDISFYRSSNMLPGDLMAQALDVATDGAFVAAPKNGSGLTVNGTIGSGPTTTTTGTINLQTFQTENADGIPDEFYVLTSVTAGGGEIQTLVAELLGYYLNSDTAGSESISDDLVKANTFEDFVASA